MSDTDDHIKAAYGPQPQYGPWRWDSSVDEIVRMDYCSSYARTRARRSNRSPILARWAQITASLGISFGVLMLVTNAVSQSTNLFSQLATQSTASLILHSIGLAFIVFVVVSIPYLPAMGVGRGGL